MTPLIAFGPGPVVGVCMLCYNGFSWPRAWLCRLLSNIMCFINKFILFPMPVCLGVLRGWGFPGMTVIKMSSGKVKVCYCNDTIQWYKGTFIFVLLDRYGSVFIWLNIVYKSWRSVFKLPQKIANKIVLSTTKSNNCY